MDNVQKNVDIYADDVLRGCYHYLGNMEDAEKAFEEVFVTAHKKRLLNSDEYILPELLVITRQICLADTLRDDDEEDLLISFFGLSRDEALYVMGLRRFYEVKSKKAYKNRKQFVC